MVRLTTGKLGGKAPAGGAGEVKEQAPARETGKTKEAAQKAVEPDLVHAQAAQKLVTPVATAAGPAASVAAKNAEILPDTTLRFSAPNEALAAHASLAISKTIEGALETAKRKKPDDKGHKPKPPTEGQVLLKLASKWIEIHYPIAMGGDENWQKLAETNPAEAAARQKMSQAFLAEISRQIYDKVPLPEAMKSMPSPQYVAVLLEPGTKLAQATLHEHMQVADASIQLRTAFQILDKAKEEGFSLGMAQHKLIHQAEKLADADPFLALDQVRGLAIEAQTWLETPRPVKGKSKKGAAEEPLPPPEVLMAKANARVKELEASVAGAPAPTVQERFQGALLAAACADAIGGAMEFEDKETILAKFGKLTDMVGGGWLDLKKGEVTDDTQMSTDSAKSILEKGGFDVADHGKRWVDWLNSDPKDVGGLTRQSLELVRIGVPADDAGKIAWQLSGYENAGNGSVMRAGPTSLLTAFRPLEQIEQTAIAASAVTHSDPRCTYGTAAIALGTSLLMKGEKDVIPQVVDYLKDKNPTLAAAIAIVPYLPEEEVRTSGYVVHTVQAAFWALHHANSLVDGITRIVSLGEDTDTAGATAGILLGAKYGAQAIPKDWLKTLQGANDIRSMADQIHALATKVG